MSMNPDCSLCIHRDPEPPQPGTIACGHPKALEIRADPEMQRMLTVATGWGPIKGKMLGVAMDRGAYYRTWPFFFDPTALLVCNGYQVANDA